MFVRLYMSGPVIDWLSRAYPASCYVTLGGQPARITEGGIILHNSFLIPNTMDGIKYNYTTSLYDKM